MGLSQKEMARFVRINQSNYNKAEQGVRRFSYSELKYLWDSTVDVQYVITGNKCGETHKEYFAQYEYEQLVNIMNIISSVGMGACAGEVLACWKNIYVNAEVLWCKEKLRDLENNRSLPDSELVWKMYQLFLLLPAVMLKDKNCLINEVCFMLEGMDAEIQAKILSIIEAIYAD